MRRHMGGRHRLPGGAGGIARRSVRDGSSGGMGGERRLADDLHAEASGRNELSKRLDGGARPSIVRAFRFEQRQHALGALRGPDGQGAMVIVPR